MFSFIQSLPQWFVVLWVAVIFTALAVWGYVLRHQENQAKIRWEDDLYLVAASYTFTGDGDPTDWLTWRLNQAAFKDEIAGTYGDSWTTPTHDGTEVGFVVIIWIPRANASEEQMDLCETISRRVLNKVLQHTDIQIGAIERYIDTKKATL